MCPICLMLQSDYSNWGTCKKIIQSQHFLKTKDSQVFFFANRPKKFRFNNENFLKNHLNLPDHSGNSPQINELMNGIGPFAKKS